MATGQTLWSMSREEYDARFGADDCEYCMACGPLDERTLIDDTIHEGVRFPLLIDDAMIEQALAEDEAEHEQFEQEKLAAIDWFGITRAFG